MSLPTNSTLAKRFDRFNSQLWEWKLPLTPVRWSRAMHACAGKYWRRQDGKMEIVLSRPYHEHYPDDVDDTLKHEMIHVWMHHQGHRRPGVSHGLVFNREARRVGASRHCKSYPGLFKNFKFQWKCPNCNKDFYSKQRRKWACGTCCKKFSSGRFDKRFRLELVQKFN